MTSCQSTQPNPMVTQLIHKKTVKNIKWIAWLPNQSIKKLLKILKETYFILLNDTPHNLGRIYILLVLCEGKTCHNKIIIENIDHKYN